jgi:hypothetical protein
MITVENRVGRVVLIRFLSPVTMTDVTRLSLQISTIAMRLGALLTVSDLRGFGQVPADVDAALRKMTTADNSVLLHRVMLASSDPIRTARLIERVRTGASGSKTKVFLDVASLKQWAKEALFPDEAADVARFLDEP